MFPVFLDLRDRLAVVVGGGPVGRRKAAALLSAGARVRLVCFEPRPADLADPLLDWLNEPFRAHHLDGAALAFAAGPAEVNRQVATAARQRGIWVNVADDPAAADFFVPAVVRRGNLLLAIGTHGAAPALARKIRIRLERWLDDAFGQWAALLAELRPVVRCRIRQPEQRRRLWRQLTAWRWLKALRRQGTEPVRRDMLARIGVMASRSGPEA